MRSARLFPRGLRGLPLGRRGRCSLDDRSREVYRGIDVTYYLSISPDGIRIIDSSGKLAKEIAVEGVNRLAMIDWAADGKGVFTNDTGVAGSGDTLLYVTLDGKVSRLRAQPKTLSGVYAIPSPDGKFLALSGYTRESNVWLMENF